MSNNKTEDADNMGMAAADEDEMKSSDNDTDEGSPGADRAGTDRAGTDRAGTDSDVDAYDNVNQNPGDTSAVEFRNGKDIQGIPWETLDKRISKRDSKNIGTTRTSLALGIVPKKIARLRRKEPCITSSDTIRDQ